MNYIKKNLGKIITAIFVFFWPIISFAVDGNVDALPGSGEKIVNPISSSSITELIRKVLEGAIKIGMPVIVLAIIYSGFLFVSAQGNTEKLNTAKRSLMYTLIGAAILLGSWAIAQLITDTVLSL